MEFLGIDGKTLAYALLYIFIGLSMYWGWWMAKNHKSGKASAKMMKAPSIFKLGAINMWWPDTKIRKRILEEKVLFGMYILLGFWVTPYFWVMSLLPLLMTNVDEI